MIGRIHFEICLLCAQTSLKRTIDEACSLGDTTLPTLGPRWSHAYQCEDENHTNLHIMDVLNMHDVHIWLFRTWCWRNWLLSVVAPADCSNRAARDRTLDKGWCDCTFLGNKAPEAPLLLDTKPPETRPERITVLVGGLVWVVSVADTTVCVCRGKPTGLDWKFAMQVSIKYMMWNTWYSRQKTYIPDKERECKWRLSHLKAKYWNAHDTFMSINE